MNHSSHHRTRPAQGGVDHHGLGTRSALVLPVLVARTLVCGGGCPYQGPENCPPFPGTCRRPQVDREDLQLQLDVFVCPLNEIPSVQGPEVAWCQPDPTHLVFDWLRRVSDAISADQCAIPLRLFRPAEMPEIPLIDDPCYAGSCDPFRCPDCAAVGEPGDVVITGLPLWHTEIWSLWVECDEARQAAGAPPGVIAVIANHLIDGQGGLTGQPFFAVEGSVARPYLVVADEATCDPIQRTIAHGIYRTLGVPVSFDPDNLMHPTGTGVNLAAEQCEQARAQIALLNGSPPPPLQGPPGPGLEPPAAPAICTGFGLDAIGDIAVSGDGGSDHLDLFKVMRIQTEDSVQFVIASNGLIPESAAGDGALTTTYWIALDTEPGGCDASTLVPGWVFPGVDSMIEIRVGTGASGGPDSLAFWRRPVDPECSAWDTGIAIDAAVVTATINGVPAFHDVVVQLPCSLLNGGNCPNTCATLSLQVASVTPDGEVADVGPEGGVNCCGPSFDPHVRAPCLREDTNATIEVSGMPPNEQLTIFLDAYEIVPLPEDGGVTDPNGYATPTFRVEANVAHGPKVLSVVSASGVTATVIANATCTGDANCDGRVDFADILAVVGDWGCCDLPGFCQGDANQDGCVEFADILEVIMFWGCHSCPLCFGDLDASGDVGFADVIRVIASWGPCPFCPEDLNDDGEVDFGDMLLVFGAWGPCP